MTASTGIKAAKAARNLKILALRGTMSFSLIGKAVGTSRDVVAGVLWRTDNPIEVRRARAAGDDRKTGTGHHGPGRYPRRTIWSERTRQGGAP